MASKTTSKRDDTQAQKTGLRPSVAHDNLGTYIDICCGTSNAQLYLDKLEESKRSLTKCILFRGSWYAPLDFESLCGRKSKKWRQSITHLGKPLSEYNLSCPKQGSQHGAGIVGSRVDTQPPCSSVTHVLDTSTPTLSVPVLQPNSCSQGSSVSSPLLISAVLSFIKAFRLRGDVDSLKKRVSEHFSPDDIENAKKLLWAHCRVDLEAAGLPFHTRRESNKRSQLAANLDDILQALTVLDASELIPCIYCEASELLRVPPLSLDPLSETLHSNTMTLESLASKIDLLETKLSSVLDSRNTNDLSTNTYAAVASSFIPPSNVNSLPSPPAHKAPSLSHSVPDARDCNIILFGLPETESIIDTKASVDETLEFLVGKSVLIRDMFRLGKPKHFSSSPDQGRPRPILIKLSTPWDRKLVLSRKTNLRNFRIPRLFLREDVPPDHRLRLRKLARKSTTAASPGVSTSDVITSNLPGSDASHVPLSAPHQPPLLPTPSLLPPLSSSVGSISRKSRSPAHLVSSRAASPCRSSRSVSPADSDSSSCTVVQGNTTSS